MKKEVRVIKAKVNKRTQRKETIFTLWEFQKEKQKGTVSIFKAKIARNFPNLRREMEILILIGQRTPNRLNTNRATLQHIIKLSKEKDKVRFLKAGRKRKERS